MQIVVMAGGLATRMRPLTSSVPKSMLPVNGLPYISYQLDLFRRNGVTDVLLCVGHLGKQIEEFVGEGSRWNLEVKYSWETDELLGTGGALKNAGSLLQESFLLTWGDSYVRADYSAFLKSHLDSGYDVSVGVFANNDKWDRSNIDFRDGRVIEYTKGSASTHLKYIDVGLSALNRAVLGEIPQGVSSLDRLYHDLSVEGKLGGIEVFDRFYEIGSKEGYEEFHRFVEDMRS